MTHDTDEYSTDLDEMGIFVLSKDQTFGICATFLDPAKFSILVIHLLKLEKKIFLTFFNSVIFLLFLINFVLVELSK